MSRILVTGSRIWHDDEPIFRAITEAVTRELHDEPHTIVHGGAPGADTLALGLAENVLLWPHEPHPAEWHKYGPAAGPIRNQEMVESNIDICLAFFIPPGRGTLDCLRRARDAGIWTKIYDTSGRNDGILDRYVHILNK